MTAALAMTEGSAHAAGRSALLTVIGSLSDRLGALSDADLREPTRRPGWTVGELLVAVHQDLQRLLRDLMRSSGGPPVQAGQWSPGASGGPGHRPASAPEHHRFVTTVASAYTAPGVLRGELAETVDAVCLAAVALPEGSVLTGGRHVSTGDLLGAWSQLLARHLHVWVEPPGR